VVVKLGFSSGRRTQKSAKRIFRTKKSNATGQRKLNNEELLHFMIHHIVPKAIE
jgi:hypothetical protein